MPYKINRVAVESLLVVFDKSQQATSAITALSGYLKAEVGVALIDMVPSYSTVLITYNLLDIDAETLEQLINRFLQQVASPGVTGAMPDSAFIGREIELPVCYHESLAPDLVLLSQTLGLTVAEIIKRHSQARYTVAAVGFSPGFGYLSGLDPRLAIPRKSTPRLSVPAGSVAIAEQQTAVYPQSTPGGWWLIGCCPLPVFDKCHSPPGLLQVGDKVRFKPVDLEVYQQIAAQAEAQL